MSESTTSGTDNPQGVLGANAEAGVIRNIGMLDLSTAKDDKALSHIRSIENVGLVLIAEHLQPVFHGIAQKNIGAVVPVPSGKPVKMMSGQLTFPGDAFAESGADQAVLVIAGLVVFTSKVTGFAYSQVIMCGQVIAPEGSGAAIARDVTRLDGQVSYYPAGGKVRVLKGSETLDQAYLQALSGPQVLVLLGQYRLAGDVTVQALREKLAGLMVIGQLHASQNIVSAVRAMASEVAGTICAD